MPWKYINVFLRMSLKTLLTILILQYCIQQSGSSSAPSMAPTPGPTVTRSSLNNIYLFAGTGSAGTGSPATSAVLYMPRGMYQDTVGKFYIAEANANAVRTVDSSGILNSFAGAGGATYTGDTGPASSATLNIPVGVFIVTTGVTYITDFGNNRVRSVSTSGIISTYVGNGVSSNNGDGGPATSGNICNPHGIWVNTLGVMYVTSYSCNQIRSVSVAGIISLICGVSSGYSGDGGPATSASMIGPDSILSDTVGMLYFSDFNSLRVRTISSTNIINLLMGAGGSLWLGDNFPATVANINGPEGVALDANNNDVYVAVRFIQRVLVLTRSTMMVSTYAGSGAPGASGNGGASTSATMVDPDGLYLSSIGKLYISEMNGNAVRVVYSVAPSQAPTLVPSSARSTSNVIYQIAGTGATGFTGTGGPATAGTFNVLRSISQDTLGRTYISEQVNNCIRMIDASGILNSAVGVCSSTGSFSGNNGPATSAGQNYPIGMQINTVGVLFCSEYGNKRVRTVSLSGIITTYAGSSLTSYSGDGGQATNAGCPLPVGLWINSVGVMYISSVDVYHVRVISASGIINLFAGTSSTASGSSGDGGAATSALFNAPEKLTGDVSGTVYISDSSNNKVRYVNTNNIIFLLMGTSTTTWGNDNVAATSAPMDYPNGMAVDPGNNDFYVSVRNNHRVLVLTRTTNLVSSFAGNGNSIAGGGNGGAASSASFNGPDGTFMSSLGDLYVAEINGHVLRVIYDTLPTISPTANPTVAPSIAPTVRPTVNPTIAPSRLPTTSPSAAPSAAPSVTPTTLVPSVIPSISPTGGPSTARSVNNIVFLLAGTGSLSNSGSGGPAVSASLNYPKSVYQDTAGGTYIVEEQSHCVRVVDASGIINAYAGLCTSSGSFGGDNFAATAAGLSTPVGLFISTIGVAYVTDFNSKRIRSVSVGGIISTFVGSGGTSDGGNGGQATAATIQQPYGIWGNTLGVVYITSYSARQIRSVAVDGIITLFAGSSVGSYGFTGDGGQVTAALLNGPERVYGDSLGMIYISDTGNGRIRTVATNIINTLAGSGSETWGNENVAATSAPLCLPEGATLDSFNNDVYISARSCNRVAVLTRTTMLVSTFAGNGAFATGSSGVPATSTALFGPDSLYLSTLGDLYIVEVDGNVVRVVYDTLPTSTPTVVPSLKPTVTPTVTPTVVPSNSPSVLPSVLPSRIPSFSPSAARSTTNIIFRLTGSGTAGMSGIGGAATAADINYPRSVFQDTAGRVYLTEKDNQCIRMIDTNNIINSFAGVCAIGGSGDFAGDSGFATAAHLSYPVDLFVSSVGVAYVADCNNNRVRGVSAGGIISTFAGTGSPTCSGNACQATATIFQQPYGIWGSTGGTLFIVVYGASQVWSVSSSGIVTVFAGSSSTSYTGDGGQATSAGLSADRLCIDSSGVVYISDTGNKRVRTVSTSNIINLLMGSGGTSWGNENVAATSAPLNGPESIGVDVGNNDVYIASTNLNRVFVLTRSSSLVSTYCGTGAVGSSGNSGPASSATLAGPYGLYLSTVGNLFVSESTYVRAIYTVLPTASPTRMPTCQPSVAPSNAPTVVPSMVPTGSPTASRSTTSIIFRIAGTGTAGFSGIGGAATAANLNYPRSVFQDTAGRIYATEQNNLCVRVVDTSNIIATFAGVCVLDGTGGYSGDNGFATSAVFDSPVGIFISTVGVAYIVDFGNNRIRGVSAAGIINTFAGNGSPTNNGNGGQATAGSMYHPYGVWGSSVGMVYVAVYGASQVRSIDGSSGIINVFAGSTTGGISGDGGQATSAFLQGPDKLVVDSSGVVYISDTGNYRVRTVSTSNIIGLLMGSGSTLWGNENVAATSAPLRDAEGIVVDSGNNDVYVASFSQNRVLVLTRSTMLVSTYCGTGTSGYSGDSGPASSATLAGPYGLYLSTLGNLYVSELNNQDIRAVFTVLPTAIPSKAPSVLPTTAPSNAPTMRPSLLPTALPSAPRSTTNIIFKIAGVASAGLSGTGNRAASAAINKPSAVFQDTVGNVYIAEENNVCVRMIDTGGIMRSFAGVCDFAGAGSFSDGTASSAGMGAPTDLYISSLGVVYVIDSTNLMVRTVSTSNIISTFAGDGSHNDIGNGIQATATGLTDPIGVSGNTMGVIYIAESAANCIRAVDASGIMTLFAGGDSDGFLGDGGKATAATLTAPQKVFADSSGMVYISDSGNNRIRAVSASNIISLLIGGGSGSSIENVAGTSVSLNSPEGMAVDTGNGDVYLAAKNLNRVLVLTRSSMLVSTFCGTGNSASNGNGGPAASASLNGPVGLYLSTVGNLYVTEEESHLVRGIYTVLPTASPTVTPTVLPSRLPSVSPSVAPSVEPSLFPTILPTVVPTIQPSIGPSLPPSTAPSLQPSVYPTTPTNSPSTASPSCNPTVFLMYTTAGTGGSSLVAGDGGPASAAQFMNIVGVFADSLGNIYIADNYGCSARKIDTVGIISRFAGTTDATSLGDNGPATSASMNFPSFLWGNTVGDMFISENYGARVRKVSTSGTITLFAGGGSGGNNVASTSLSIGHAFGVMGDTLGQMYIVDRGNNKVQLVSVSGIVTLFCGTGAATFNGESIAATSTNLNDPQGIYLVGQTAYVAEANRVRTVNSARLTASFAGNGITEFNGDGGTATAASINSASGLYVETTSTLYIVTYGDARMRQVSAAGIIYTVAGIGSDSYGGGAGGPAISSGLSFPSGLWEDSLGAIYVSCHGYLRKMVNINPTVVPTAMPTMTPTVAPSVLPTLSPSLLPTLLPTIGPTTVPSVLPSRLPSVSPSVAPSAAPSAYPSILPTVAPTMVPTTGPSPSPSGNPSLKPTAVPTTPTAIPSTASPSSNPTVFLMYSPAGTGTYTVGGDGGPASAAQFMNIVGVFCDSLGVIYFADNYGNSARRIDSAGIISRFAGTTDGSSLGDGGPATSATMFFPSFIWGNTLGVIYITEREGYRARSVSPSGIISLFAGGGSGGNNVAATAAGLLELEGIMGDTLGQVYIVDATNNKVRMVTTSGIITLFCGFGTVIFNGENVAATSTALGYPMGVYVAGPNVYITEINRVRLVNTGATSTFAGNGVTGFSGDGGMATSASINAAVGVYAESAGSVYLVTYGDSRVRQVSSSSLIYTVAGVGSNSYTGGTGGPAISSGLEYPSGLWEDSLGAIYVSCHGYLRKMVNINPTVMPSVMPTVVPTVLPTVVPTLTPSFVPTVGPTVMPSAVPTVLPTPLPTTSPTQLPSIVPSCVPTTTNPSAAPSLLPSVVPSLPPTLQPSVAPTVAPSITPTTCPTTPPSKLPTISPSISPTILPSMVPTVDPSLGPTVIPTVFPTVAPSYGPTICPSFAPSLLPSVLPSLSPTLLPSVLPSLVPSVLSVSCTPSTAPSFIPTVLPSIAPSMAPSVFPSLLPSVGPGVASTVAPTVTPSTVPSALPSTNPSPVPSAAPSTLPSLSPSLLPSQFPSLVPTVLSSPVPTITPTIVPSTWPSVTPTPGPTVAPSTYPLVTPTVTPSIGPTLLPTGGPSVTPSLMPSGWPVTNSPTLTPSRSPSVFPSTLPATASSVLPSVAPTVVPSRIPTAQPSVVPSTSPTLGPTLAPSPSPTLLPSVLPSLIPSTEPTPLPTDSPSDANSSPPVQPPSRFSSVPSIDPSTLPTVVPSVTPNDVQTTGPSVLPTLNPSVSPSMVPSSLLSTTPSVIPSELHSLFASVVPSQFPTPGPSEAASALPSALPTPSSTLLPTVDPSIIPSVTPTVNPTVVPSHLPSLIPTLAPSKLPTLRPTALPSLLPSLKPSKDPTLSPTLKPSKSPSVAPTRLPTKAPALTGYPTVASTRGTPTVVPTKCPSVKPSIVPTKMPSLNPTTLLPSLFPTTFVPSAPPSVENQTHVPTEPPTALPTLNPTFSLSPTIAPSAIPSLAPTSVMPTALPSEVDAYQRVPVATFPRGSGIFLIEYSGQNWKIVLPYSLLTSDRHGQGFTDIVLTPGSLGSSYLLSSGASSDVSVSTDFGYLNSVAVDDAKRSAAILGDVNQDDYDDIIIGDPYVPASYVLFGSSRSLSTNMTQGFTIFGESSGDLTGWSVSGAGDVNNDTINDIIVGAPFAFGTGAFYVIYGRAVNNTDVYLSELTSELGFVVYGATKSDYLGISVSSAGDVNKDGFDDVIVGSLNAVTYYSGNAYVVFGGASLSVTAPLSPDLGFKVIGSAYSYSGCSVSAAGDVNKDGFGDVLIGSSPTKAGVSPSAYIVFGSSSIAGSTVVLSSLTTGQGIRVSGSGMIVSGGQDFNSDGTSDVLVTNIPLSAASTVGYIVYSDVANMIHMTSAPVRAPSLKPTIRPTDTPLAPTLLPTRKPSLMPSVTPTTPSVAPSVGLSVPTAEPSEEPTAPTESPSSMPVETTIAPSVKPSEEPSEIPTLEPSETPSEPPTEMPTESPTVTSTISPSSVQPSLFPVFIRPKIEFPTLSPSVLTAQYLNITGVGGDVNTTNGIVYLLVNTTGNVFVNIPLLSIKTITVAPEGRGNITIPYFNNATDVIDLSMYKTLTFKSLRMTEGSITIWLTSTKIMHILNLHLHDLTERNFVFYVGPKDTKKTLSLTVKALALTAFVVIAMIAAFLIQQFYQWRLANIAKMLLDAEEPKMLLVIDTYLDGSYVEKSELHNAVEDDEESNVKSSARGKSSVGSVSSEDSKDSDMSSVGQLIRAASTVTRLSKDVTLVVQQHAIEPEAEEHSDFFNSPNSSMLDDLSSLSGNTA